MSSFDRISGTGRRSSGSGAPDRSTARERPMHWLPFVSEGWSLVVSGVRVGGRGGDSLSLKTGPRLLLNRIERDPNLKAETAHMGAGPAGNGDPEPPPEGRQPSLGLLYRAGQFLFSLSF